MGVGVFRGTSSPHPIFGSRNNSSKEGPVVTSNTVPSPTGKASVSASASRFQRTTDTTRGRESNKSRDGDKSLELTRNFDGGYDVREEVNEKSNIGNGGDDDGDIDDSCDDGDVRDDRNNCLRDNGGVVVGGGGGVGEGEEEIKSIPFLWPTPLRIFFGHTQDVIDISWSKSHFILSASADHNVRLWHVTRGDCLQVFRHPDIATSIDFHPLHDRYFISGCFDRRLRVWDIISDARTKEWVSLSETVRLDFTQEIRSAIL